MEKIIKSLEQMGFEVVNNTQSRYIMAMLRTRSGYGAYYSLFYEDLQKEGVVEHIVSQLIARIKGDL